jgi:glycosyltransferase involved in cell wall biosynthesis
MGLPVIATKCGGPQDYVNESNGRLAEINDPDSLAQQMSFVMKNKDKFDSKLIMEGIIDKYSPKSIARQLVDLYKGL